MKFNNNEEAVSPVIGVILMVAITVILAAVIAVFVFDMSGNMETSHSVAVTSKMVNSSAIMFTLQGGSDAGIIDYIQLEEFDGNGQHKAATAADLKFSHTDATIVDKNVKWDDPSVGESLTIEGFVSPGRVTVTAYFTDGTNQQILNKQF